MMKLSPIRIAALSTLVLALGCTSGQADDLASAGLELARQHRLVEAIENFDAALEADPKNLKALYNGGLANLYLRKGAQAAQRFETFVGLRPDDSLGHFNLARAYAVAFRKEEAIGALKRAVELGFDRHDELMGGGFESIEDDIRFAQIEILVAQRAGVGVEAADRAGALGYGGQRMRTTMLPGQGQRINRSCVGPKAPPGVSGMEVDFENDCKP